MRKLSLSATNNSVVDEGSGAGQFQQPYDVRVTLDGELFFVADYNNHRVQVLRTSDLEHVHTIGSQGSGDGYFQQPPCLCLSPHGDVVFATDDHHRVQVFSMSNC